MVARGEDRENVFGEASFKVKAELRSGCRKRFKTEPPLREEGGGANGSGVSGTTPSLPPPPAPSTTGEGGIIQAQLDFLIRQRDALNEQIRMLEAAQRQQQGRI